MSINLRSLSRTSYANSLRYTWIDTDALVDGRLMAVKKKIAEQQKHLKELDKHMYVAT